MWGFTPKILPTECGNIFWLLFQHFFVLTFEEAKLRGEVNQNWVRG